MSDPHPWRARRPPPETTTSAPPSPGGGGGDRATYDPGAHTVADVLAYVAEHPEERDAIWASETAGKARTTLLDAL